MKKSLLCLFRRLVCHSSIRKNSNFNLLSLMEKMSVTDNNINLAELKMSSSLKSSKYNLHVLCSGNSLGKGLYVFTDHVRYLFNCGEGIQRIATEYNLKLIKVHNIFITSPTWENIGGLLGVILSLQSLGITNVKIYGPPRIHELIAATEAFITMKSIKIHLITEINRVITVANEPLKIKLVPLFKDTSNVNKANSDSKLKDLNIVQKNVNIRSPTKDLKLKRRIFNRYKMDSCKVRDVNEDSAQGRSVSEVRGSKVKNKNFSLCYICETSSFCGKLNLEKCLEYKVPVGPLLGRLKNGEDVRLSDGTIVKCDQVVSDSCPPKTFIVVDCPSEEYLHALLIEPAFVPYQTDPEIAATVVIHFTKLDILNLPKYQEWMCRFPESTKHLIMNQKNLLSSNLSVYRLQRKLNVLHPGIFPALDESDIPVVGDHLAGKAGYTGLRVEKLVSEEALNQKPPSISEDDLKKPALSPIEEVYVPEMNHKLTLVNGISTLTLPLNPNPKFLYRHEMVMDPESQRKEVTDLTSWVDVRTSFEKMCEELEQTEEYKNLPDYPKILFLGTGSSVPYALRNTSGLLIFLDENKYFLLDCGEGTYNQMERIFGRQKIQDVLLNLEAIYVSHPHADHHLGIVTILQARKKFLKEKLYEEKIKDLTLFLPKPVHCWLQLCDENYEPVLDNTNVITNAWFHKIGYTSEYIRELQIVKVKHCSQAYGISFTHKNGCKITYSGDTMPDSNLIKIGQNSNILVHEATLEDELQSMAAVKKHSTISQAIEVGREMNAKHVILTHFSQRYSHLPLLPVTLPDNVGIAFDNMLVNEKLCPLLPKMTDIYKVLFAEQLHTMDGRKQKRLIKNDLKMRKRNLSLQETEEFEKKKLKN